MAPQFAFASKAQTLRRLQPRLRSARVADLAVFTVADWTADRSACCARVLQMGGAPWIVRSSCRHEDGAQASKAGAYLSRLDVRRDGLEAAVEAVIASYGPPADADEVLVQPMLDRVVRAGVALSHDPNTASPYRIVNWVDGADTTAITGGMSGRTWQQAARSPHLAPAEIAAVIGLVEELLALFGGAPLDCEFAVTREPEGETLWLLQVRPLAATRDFEPETVQAERLAIAERKIADGFRSHPFLCGRNTLFGVMPDWNPAEIIGIRPRPLALSLYRNLVTDSIWAYQRHNYGYRDLRSFPLLLHVFGLPYIDVRVSFNSFIPADLDEGLAARLVDHYTDCLAREPGLHDKVEFDIVFSCYTLDLPDRLARLEGAGFSRAECITIADSLRRLTKRILHPNKGLWRSDAARIQTLRQRRETLAASGAGVLERIYWLLEDTKRHGTLPFAGLARAGFVAVQMLRSLVTVGVLSPEEAQAFLGGVSTVSSQLGEDRRTLDREAFLQRYGHLRPGTYDICSPRYDEQPDAYFDWSQPSSPVRTLRPFPFTLPQMRQLREALQRHDLRTDPIELLTFLQAAIEMREEAKFVFTRNLSDALALMTAYGEGLGLSREDLAYCDVGVFSDLHIGAARPREALLHSIDAGRRQYAETLRLSLPPLITRPEDVWGFATPTMAPSFITQGDAVGHVASVDDRDRLTGAIVCLPSADPGYDWLFTFPIAGFVTAWGGVNSHMAIRAGELGLPAVIGAGDDQYRRWASARRLRLDCAGRRVEILG